jgi:tRNA(adenine34) deaminase
MKKTEAVPVGETPAVGAAGNDFMAAALAAARRALLAGEAPVGASIVRDGELIATSATSVIGSFDITAHAEINAIRQAMHRLGSLTLAGSELYVTVEPCAMCAGACHYAGITRIFYGAALADLHAWTRNEFVAGPAGSTRLPQMQGGIMRDESLELLAAWGRARGRQ